MNETKTNINPKNMTRTEITALNNAAVEGTIADDLNPAFILSSVHTELLSKIAKGEFNMEELAKRTLENRGLDINGTWAGFNHEIK